MRRIALLVVVTLGWAPVATARTVRVPGGAGTLSAVYQRLHAAGLKVTIPQSFVSDSGRARRVIRMSPRPGVRTPPGSTVTLTVGCCATPARATRRRSRPILVGGFAKDRASAAATWAAKRSVRFVAHLGHLRAGGAPTLLGNFRVTRQSPAKRRWLTPGAMLSVWATQPSPPAPPGEPKPPTPPSPASSCTLPTGAELVASDDQALVFEQESSDAYGDPFQGLYGCVRPSGQPRLLWSVSPVTAYASRVTHVALGGVHVAFSTEYNDRYGICGASVDLYDLGSGAGGDVYPGERCFGPLTEDWEEVDALTVSADGFAAWHSGGQFRGLTSVACPTQTQCWATDDGGDLLSAGGVTASGWSLDHLDGVTDLERLTCPSVSLCLALDDRSRVLTSTDPSDAGSWTVAPTPSSHAVSAISCPSTALCLAVAGSDVLVSTDPAGGAPTWTAVHPAIPPSATLVTISCPTQSLCVATDSKGDVVTSSDPAGGATTWSVADIVGTLSQPSDELLTVSCTAQGICAAGDVWGSVASSSDPTAGASAWTVAHVAPDGLDAIVCRPTLCAATDGGGDVLTTTDPTGASPQWTVTRVPVPPDGNLQAVACPNASTCLAVGMGGVAAVSTDPTGGPGAWTSAQADPPGCPSCASERLMVHDNQGTRLVDSTPPTDHLSLANIQLDGDVLRWTHDGTPHQATLG